MDDFARLRQRRLDFLRPEADRSVGRSPAFVGKVTTASPAVGKFLLVNPTAITGAEMAGGAGIVTVDTSTTVPVYLVGPAAATTGDLLACRHVPYRWVAERMTTSSGGPGGGIPIPDCFCATFPTTLNMTSTAQSCSSNIFQSATITYQAVPSWAATLFIGSSAFLSTTSFVDSFLPTYPFYYLLQCLYNQVTLTRIYQASPYGSPYRDGVLFSWLMGMTVNTCSPFALTNGSPYGGSTCSGTSVTISG